MKYNEVKVLQESVGMLRRMGLNGYDDMSESIQPSEVASILVTKGKFRKEDAKEDAEFIVDLMNKYSGEQLKNYLLDYLQDRTPSKTGQVADRLNQSLVKLIMKNM